MSLAGHFGFLCLPRFGNIQNISTIFLQEYRYRPTLRLSLAFSAICNVKTSIFTAKLHRIDTVSAVVSCKVFWRGCFLRPPRLLRLARGHLPLPVLPPVSGLVTPLKIRTEFHVTRKRHCSNQPGGRASHYHLISRHI